MLRVQPQIRVGFMRMLVGSVHRLEDPIREPASAALEDVTRRVHAAPMLGWMPGDANFEAVERLTEALGDEGASDFFRRLFSRVWTDASFMSAFIRGIVRMHPDPGAYLKYLQPGSRQIFRDFGTWQVRDRTSTSSIAEYVDAHPRCFAMDAAWIRLTAASLETVYDFAGVEGRVEMVDASPDDHRAVLRFDWQPKR